jgi:hypothetical protein
MASAQQAAATRVARALALVTDKIVITNLSKKCRVTTDPEDALDGKFTDLGLDDPRMPFFRDILSDECPEVGSEIDDEEAFPLAADIDISVVIDSVAALLRDSDKWQGRCLPHDAPNE